MRNEFRFGLVILVLTFVAALSVHAEHVSKEDHELSLLVGRSHIVDSEHRVSSVIVANPAVADAEVISPSQVVVYGKRLGATDVIMQYEDGSSSRYYIDILIDDSGLQARLDSLFGRGIVVDARDGVLVLKGNVNTVADATRLEEFMSASGHSYVDMTSIPGIQQVLLKVRIAEVARRGL